MDVDQLARIRALARIPRTPDGPDWRQASPEDRALAEKLLNRDWPYLRERALWDVRHQGGAVRFKDRKVESHADDPYDDDDGPPNSDNPPIAPAYRWEGTDTGMADIVSQLPTWWHEAALRYRPEKGASWPGWLARVISSRIHDFLSSGSGAGTVDRGDPPKYDPTYQIIEDRGLTHIFEAADAEVRGYNGKYAAILHSLWIDRLSMAELGRKNNIKRDVVSKRFRYLRKRLPNFAAALQIEKATRRELTRSEKQATKCNGFRTKSRETENFADSDSDFCPDGNLLRVGPRMLEFKQVGDPELRPPNNIRERLVNREPVADVLSSDLATREVIAEAVASRDKSRGRTTINKRGRCDDGRNFDRDWSEIRKVKLKNGRVKEVECQKAGECRQWHIIRPARQVLPEETFNKLAA